MKAARIICLLALLSLLAVSMSAFAQEGFPLNGTWSGNWGPANAKEDDRNYTTLVMSWDGKKISGLVDPGPDSATFKSATLDSSKWTVRLEYDLKDRAGKLLPFVVEAKLVNAASRKGRMLDGTYTHGTTKGTFKVSMDQ
jgi:hypothetical protein